MASPIQIRLMDWATEPLTAASLDIESAPTHPTGGLPNALNNLWEGKLLFAGSEIGDHFAGYLEGALEASEAVFQLLNTKRNQ